MELSPDWPSGFRETRPVGSVFPPEESIYSAEIHDQMVVTAWDGTPIGVDAAIAPLLTALWHRGYRTWFSCQGGEPGGEELLAYIEFATPQMARDVITEYQPSTCTIEDSVVRFPPGSDALPACEP